MSRLANINHKKIIKVLKTFGFEEKRQTGSHLILRNKETKKIVVVPVHNKDLKVGVVRVIIKQSNLSRDDFLKNI